MTVQALLRPVDRQQADIRTELAGFAQFGAPTRIETSGGIDYYINEFWTARQRQAARLHEISYRACFKPQLPAFFIDRLTRPGDVVYDPFMGRGTTLVEAALRGRVPFGNDINPLSRTMTAPRLNTPHLDDVFSRLRQIPWQEFTSIAHEELLTFYHPGTLALIEGLRGWLLRRKAEGLGDALDEWIAMVSVNRLTGHSPGFFSVYTLPPNQAASVQSQRRINEARGQTPPFRDVADLIARKSKVLLSDGPVSADRSLILTGQANSTSRIAEGEVALTVTSPPFLDIVDYEADNWLRCWFLGIDPGGVPISRHRKLEDWQGVVSAVLAELTRVTRPGGHIAFEVGEVRNGSVRLEEAVVAAAAGLPLDPLGVMVNQQDFTKTSNCWGIANNARGTNTNRIVLFRRQG